MAAPKSMKGSSSARSTRSNAVASKRSAPDSASDEVSSRAKKPRTIPKKEARTSRSGKRREESEEEEEEEDVDMANEEEEEQQNPLRGHRKPPTSRPPPSTSASAPVKTRVDEDIWSKLKAETLRSVIKDIGQGRGTTKEAMVSQLQAMTGTARAGDAWSQLKAMTLRSVLKDVGEEGATTKEAMISQFQAILEDAAPAKHVETVEDSDDELPYMTASASAPPRTRSPFKSKPASSRFKPQSRPSTVTSRDEQAKGPSTRTTRSAASASAKPASKPTTISRGRKCQRDAEEEEDAGEDGGDVSAEEAEEADEEEDEPLVTRSSARSRGKQPEVPHGRNTRSSGVTGTKVAPKAAAPSAGARKRRREAAPTSDEDERVREAGVGSDAEEEEEEDGPEDAVTRSSARSLSKRARATSELAKPSSKQARPLSKRASKRVKSSGGRPSKAPSPIRSPSADVYERLVSDEEEKPASDEEEKPVSDEEEKFVSDEEQELISDDEEAFGPRKRRSSTRTSTSVSAQIGSPARRRARAKADAVEAEIIAKANARLAREGSKPRGEPDQDGETTDDGPTIDTFEADPEPEVSTPASFSPPPQPSLNEPISVSEHKDTQSASTGPAGNRDARGRRWEEAETSTHLASTSPVGEDVIAASSSRTNDVKAGTTPRGKPSTRSRGKQVDKSAKVDIKGKGKARAVVESDEEGDVSDDEPELVDQDEDDSTRSPGACRPGVLASRNSRMKSRMKTDVQVALCDEGYSSDEEPAYGHDPTEGTGDRATNGTTGFRLNLSTPRPLGEPARIHCFVFEDNDTMEPTTLSDARKKKPHVRAKAEPSSSALSNGFVDLPTITTIDDDVPPTFSASGRVQRKRSLSPKKAEALAHAAEVKASNASMRASQGARKRYPKKTPKPSSVGPATGQPHDSNANTEGDLDDSYLMEDLEHQAPALASRGEAVEKVGPPRSSSRKVLPKSSGLKPASGSSTPQTHARPSSSRQENTQVLDHVKVPKRVRRSGAGTGGSTPTRQLSGDLDADGSDVAEEENLQQHNREPVEQQGLAEMSTIEQTITVETTTTEVVEQRDANEPEMMADPSPPPVITEVTVTTVETIQNLDEENLTAPLVNQADDVPETSAPASDASPLQAPVSAQQTSQSTVLSPASQPESYQPSLTPRKCTPTLTASEGPESLRAMDAESLQPVGSPALDFPQGEMIIETTTTEVTTTVTEETPAGPSQLEDTLPRVESTRSWESVVLEQSPSSPTPAASGQLPGVGDVDIRVSEAGTGLMSGNSDVGFANELLNADSSLVPSNLDADIMMENTEGAELLLAQGLHSISQSMEANSRANGAEAVSSSPGTPKASSLSPKPDTLPARLVQTSSLEQMPAKPHSATNAMDSIMLDNALAGRTQHETTEIYHAIVDESLSLPDPIPPTPSAAAETTRSTSEPALSEKTTDAAGSIIDEYTTFVDPVPSTSSEPLQIGALSPGKESNGGGSYDADPYTQRLYDLKNSSITPHSPLDAAGSSLAQGPQASSIASTSKPALQTDAQNSPSDKSPSQWGRRLVD